MGGLPKLSGFFVGKTAGQRLLTAGKREFDRLYPRPSLIGTSGSLDAKEQSNLHVSPDRSPSPLPVDLPFNDRGRCGLRAQLHEFVELGYILGDIPLCIGHALLLECAGAQVSSHERRAGTGPWNPDSRTR